MKNKVRKKANKEKEKNILKQRNNVVKTRIRKEKGG